MEQGYEHPRVNDHPGRKINIKSQTETDPPEVLTGSRTVLPVKTDDLKDDSGSEKMCGFGAVFFFSHQEVSMHLRRSPHVTGMTESRLTRRKN